MPKDGVFAYADSPFLGVGSKTAGFVGKVVVCTVLLSGLSLLYIQTSTLQQPLHAWQASFRAHTSSTASVCSRSGAAGASGATGTLFSGTKQRTYDGNRVMSGSAGASLPLSKGIAAAMPQSRARNWAVVTTINAPTEAVLGVAALPDWSVVVIGDITTPQYNTSNPNIHFLSADAQQQLAAPYADFAGQLPWKHFGRKNVGYLYAILQGAESVWDFDDDNALKPGKTPELPSASVYQVEVLDPSACTAFNPYPRMGGPSAVDPVMPPSWPRGFPLDLIRTACPHRLIPSNTSKVAVVQSLADHDPDVDAIYRMTRGVPFSFAGERKDTLVLPEGSLAPWNAQATLVLQPALWGLLLPVTVHGRVSDIWRSYIVQRLLWDAGYAVAFAPPMVVQKRGPHNYLADMQAEADLYAKSSQLVQFLRSWRGSAPSIPGRYEELMIELYERSYVEVQDVALTQEWLRALTAGGYRFPGVVPDTARDKTLQQQQQQQQQRVHLQPLLQDPLSREPNTTTLQQSANKSTPSAWAVVLSSAASPTAAVKKLAALPGWQVAVVADSRGALANTSAQAWKWPNVTYLDEEQQYLQPYQVLKHLPPSSYSRKVLGYLYAISQGATMLYDGDDSVELLQSSIPMLSCNSSNPEIRAAFPDASNACQGTLTMLMATSSQPYVFNPYPLFGQPHICPRGIHPASLRRDTGTANVCFQRAAAMPLIQAGLINGRPDVDPTYHGSQPMDVTFERSGFSVVFPHHVAAPVNSLNTLYLQEAFWALLLPASTEPEVGDLWRGLWAQRLLREVGGHLALLPPTANRASSDTTHGSSPHTLHPKQASQTAALWQKLAAVRLTSHDLPGRMLEAAKSMADQTRLQPQDIAMLQAWIADLHQLAYRFPAVTGTKASPPAQVSSTPLPQTAAWMTYGSLDGAYLFPQQWCTRLDTVLVININRIGDDKLKQQMRMLHAAYRPHYRRVFFAGSEASKWVPPEPRMQLLMDQGYLMNCGNHSIHAPDVGFFTYACAAEGVLAAQQTVWRPDQEVETVNMFYINDDVVFSPCMAQKLNHTKVWYPSPLTGLTNLTNMQGWYWDSDMAGRAHTIRQSITNALGSAWGRMVPQVAGRAQPLQVTQNNNQGDVYYVPARLMHMFAKLAAHFQSHWVMSEAAVPNMLSLLIDGPGDVEAIGFAMAWGGGRACLEQSLHQVMPLGADINQERVRSCGANIMTGEEYSKRASMFAIHPLKMSNTNVSDYFLGWWLSQECRKNAS